MPRTDTGQRPPPDDRQPHGGSREVADQTPQQNPPLPRPPILAKEEASRRAALLSDLQSALAVQGVSSVLARYHRLVLGGGRTKCEPSGPTDPQLHIFTPDGTDIATTRGSTYHFASGHPHPTDDPARAAHQFEALNGNEQPLLSHPLAAPDGGAR